jgi:hypothetical protein
MVLMSSESTASVGVIRPPAAPRRIASWMISSLPEKYR